MATQYNPLLTKPPYPPPPPGPGPTPGPTPGLPPPPPPPPPVPGGPPRPSVPAVPPKTAYGPPPGYGPPGEGPGHPYPNPTPSGAPTPDPFDAYYQNTILAHPDVFDTNISKDQWKAWEPLRDPNCSDPRAPYRNENVDDSGAHISGCFAKPVDCPNGTAKVGMGKCSQHAGMGGGQGGPGGLGGGPGGMGGGGWEGFNMDPNSMNSLLGSTLAKMLNGPSRYTPEVMQTLLSALKQNEEGSIASESDAAKADAAARGMFGSGALGQTLSDIRRKGQAGLLQGDVQYTQAKINADYQDKVTALQQSQSWLNALRDELYRRDLTAIQRQQFAANLDLAYANLQSQIDSLKYTTGMNLLGSASGSGMNLPANLFGG